MEVVLVLAIIWVIWYLALRGQSTKSRKKPVRKAEPSVTIRVSTSRSSWSDSSPPDIRRDLSPDEVWVPPGQSTTIHGLTIPGGCVYMGSGLGARARWDIEAALIDPDLAVDLNEPDHAGQHMDCWPTYRSMHPASRAAFLLWLSGGKRDPGACIGYVFLYFYGLERRLLADSRSLAQARGETRALVAEVQRLLAIYGSNNSFRGYAGRLLATLLAQSTEDRLYRGEPPIEEKSYELPLGFKVGLAQMAVDGVPLSADWALAWVQSDPAVNLRTPAHRCPEEFGRLFRKRYADKFGEGYRFKPNKTMLSASYRPASPSLEQVVFSLGDLPDVTVLKRPMDSLSQIAEDCVNDLDAYSRFLGRNPDQNTSLAALALLPSSLLNPSSEPWLSKLSNWLKDRVQDKEGCAVEAANLLALVPGLAAGDFGRREAIALAQLLEKFGVGIEPDMRFGSLLTKTEQVVLFPLSEKASQAPSPQYGAATLILHLAALVSGADGSISCEEEQHLEAQLETWLHLDENERTRLRAHTRWLLLSPPGFAGVKKRLEQLDTSRKQGVGRFMVGIAQADGVIDPNEIKVLSKIYDLLGLDTRELYNHAHAAATEPVTVQPPGAELSGFSIPAARKEEKRLGASVHLDMDQVQAKLVETATVSAMLREIFAQDEEPCSTLDGSVANEGIETIAGLDPEHSALMRTLAVKLSWSRMELEALAAKMNLMIDGALETLNEAAFDTFDEPFFEGEDPIEINPEIAKEVCA